MSLKDKIAEVRKRLEEQEIVRPKRLEEGNPNMFHLCLICDDPLPPNLKDVCSGECYKLKLMLLWYETGVYSGEV
jgi:hypothetical protein